MGLFRRKNKNARPAREDTRSWPAGRPARYLEIPEIDNWRPLPFRVPPTPDRETELRSVEQEVESLRGALDEGTGAALDQLITYRLAGWLATVHTEYADHTAVIDIHRGQALQWMTDSKILARHEREKLELLRADYLASRARLGGAAGPDLGRNQA